MTASLKKLLGEQREKQRMESELNVAQEVQRNLFPHTAIDLPELEVYGTCEPARTIGGDYYDFIPFGGCQIYLSLGDISGKGISAALLMASLHSAVRAYRAAEGQQEVGVEESLSPGRLLGLLNRHLYTSTQPAKYATLFLASYDCETRRLTYANGGHPPPVVLRADGSVQRLECGGCVVGLLEGMVYEEETVELGKGDLLMAYSDGLSEPERDGEDFGEARLIEVVRAQCDSAARGYREQDARRGAGVDRRGRTAGRYDAGTGAGGISTSALRAVYRFCVVLPLVGHFVLSWLRVAAPAGRH